MKGSDALKVEVVASKVQSERRIGSDSGGMSDEIAPLQNDEPKERLPGGFERDYSQPQPACTSDISKLLRSGAARCRRTIDNGRIGSDE